MDLCNESCLFSQPVVLRGKHLDIVQYTQTFQPNVFIPAMLISTSDFYHFMPLSLTLALVEVTMSANLLVSFFPTHFKWPGCNFKIMLKQLS